MVGVAGIAFHFRVLKYAFSMLSKVFDSTGAFLLRFGDFGSEPGQMIRPKSVAETINNNYLVCDFDLHCIHVFQPMGSYMSRFGQRNLAGPSVRFCTTLG